MNRTRFLVFLLTALLHIAASAQTIVKSSYLKQLHEINTQMADAYLHRDLKKLNAFYAEDAISMPEYHNVLIGRQVINMYHKLWFDSARVTRYTITTHDITKTYQYLIETGTFVNEFTKTGKPPYDYQGKFIHIWRIEKSSLKLVSEISGSIRNLDRSQLVLSKEIFPDTASIPKPKNTPTKLMLDSLNSQVADLVVKRKGADFARYYTDDAIYMPYYMPMLEGKKAIDAYYVEHEDPATHIAWAHIHSIRVVDLGDFVLADGYYLVHWLGGNSEGTVTGKNLNVWKRDANGNLLLYRQMAVHD